MEGYEVITSDDHKVGRVVGESGDNLIVESGTLFKSRHALPRTFVEVDADAAVVRTTLSKKIIDDSPKLDGDDFDTTAVAAHYGLAAGDPAPPTEGYGELVADDPAQTADADAQRAGVETGEQQRARIRDAQNASEGPLDTGVSPGATGGDRFRDAR